MPKRQNKSQSPPSSSTMNDANASIPSAISFKELSARVPLFSSPARVWAAKVKLAWTDGAVPPELAAIIKQRLPPHLFDQVEHLTLAPWPLLEKISVLDGPTKTQAAHDLFSSAEPLLTSQVPSLHYRNLVRLASRALPESSPKECAAVAWQKLMHTLPRNIQQLLLTASQNKPLEDVLELVDQMWTLEAPLNSASQSFSANKITDPTTSEKPPSNFIALEAKLEGIEAAIKRYQPSSPSSTTNGICWYHQRFGQQAQKCLSPCKFISTRKNERGAPAP